MRKTGTRLFSFFLIVLMFLSLLTLPALASEEALSVAASVLEAVETASAEEAAPALAIAKTASVDETAPAADAPVLRAGAAPATHEELAAALAAGGEVTLGGDIALNGTLTVPAGVSVVLDLNGHAITSHKFTAIDVCGELTVRDSVGTGSVATSHSVAYESCYTITAQGGSVLVIEGGNFTGTGVLNASDGVVKITGGTFTQDGNANCYLFFVYFCSLDITGGTFRNLGTAEGGGGVIGAFSSQVSVTGGTFEDKGPLGMLYLIFSDVTVEGGSFCSKSIDLSNVNTLAIAGGTFVADSILFPPAELAVTGGTFRTSAGAAQPDALAVLTDAYFMDEQGTVHYQPLPDTTEELAAALAAGGEVVLGRDIELTETLVVPAGAEAVLELNGHALTALNITLLDVRGKLTVRDSVGTGSMHATYVDDPDDPYDRCWTMTSQAGAVLIIESGSFSGGGVVLNPYGGDITVNGGTFFGDSIPVSGHDCTITINGGTFRSSKEALAPQNSVVTVNGGTFENTSDYSLFHVFNSSVTIEDGTFSGKNLLFLYGKEVTVNGGTFTGEKITFPENSFVTGGVFTLREVKRWVVVEDTVEDTGEPFLAGGTFLDPSGAVLPVDEHIVAGYYQDADGTVRLRIVGGNTTEPPDPTESPEPSASPVSTEEPQPSARPQTTSEPQPAGTPIPTAPATGDDASVALWAAVLVLCAAAMWLTVRALKKKI